MATATQLEFAAPYTPRAAAEFELLCACCRGADVREVVQLLGHPLDWNRLLDLASHHRVLPVACGSLQNYVAGGTRTQLSERFTQHQLRVLRFSAELTGILRCFEKYGIVALPFKGPALAQVLYGDPAMREFGDLDLLVRPADVAPARAALRDLGYEPKLRLSPPREREYLRSGYELVFGSGTEKHLIELHWQVLPRFYSISFQTEAILARSIEIQFEGNRIRVPRNEDLILMLCVHAAKHEWSQLGMIRDIAALARFDPDWGWIEAEARRLGIMKIVLISLLMARNVLRAPVPAVLESSALIPSSEIITAMLVKNLIRGGQPDVESLRYFRLMMQLRERQRDRARFAWSLASTPGIEEWKSVALADSLSSLYYLVRVARLSRRLVRILKES